MAIASSSAYSLSGDDDDDNNNDDDNGNDNDNDPWLRRYQLQQELQQETDDNNNTTDESSIANDNAGSSSTSTSSSNSTLNLPFPLLYDVSMLERFILLCAQEVTGGLRDKPSKPRDFYHTCYNLSGLSIAQHCCRRNNDDNDNDNDNDDDDENYDEGFGDAKQTLVEMTHPCYNIRIDRVAAILDIDWNAE